MKYLITGGCGFIGSNLALEVLKKGHDLIIVDNLSRLGSDKNYYLLKEKGLFKFYNESISDKKRINGIIQVELPDVIFHLAGQVAMTTSISNPYLDFQTNALGTLNLLEAVRMSSKNSIIIYSSTNKVYGDLSGISFHETNSRYCPKDYPNGFDESLNLNFHSPYGCSKGTADQYLQDYHRIYGMNTVVFRHSSMYGGNQHPSFDQGWISWFCKKALEIKEGTLSEKFTVSGNGKQVRDLLYSSDVVDLYFSAAENINLIKGDVFNIGGGIDNSMSILELFNFLEGYLKISFKNNIEFIPPRESDQVFFVGNNNKINNLIGWLPKVKASEGLLKTIEWLK
jgi:CDP-paratose 2-epimerase